MAGRGLYSDIALFAGRLALLLTLITAKPFALKKGSAGCPFEQVLLKGPGIISSPGYHGQYSANTRCTWFIKAPTNSWIKLKFNKFDVKSGTLCDVSRCRCDYVQIQSYQRGLLSYSKRFCEGHNPVGVISIASNKVQVHFRRNSLVEGSGFVLKFWFEKRQQKNIKSRSAKQDIPSNIKPIKLTSDVKREVTSRKVRRSASPSNTSGVVVTYREDEEKAKKEEEEADPPDAIVLGPSIPIILIFLGVVASIAWWQFRSDQKERLRYYKEQIRYEEISKRTKNRFKKKKKQSMREIRMKKLYGDMAKHWQAGTQTQGGSPNIEPSAITKRSFAGRLLELAEKPVSYIRTPRSSRPSSVVIQEQEVPLVIMRDKKDIPVGHQPPSRPASVLLRDALNMIFGGTANAGETGEKMTNVKEDEESATLQTAPEPTDDSSVKTKPPPLLIPHIMVRQPSCDGAGESDVEHHKRSPTIREIKISSTSKKNKPASSEDKKEEPHQPEMKPEEALPVETAPTDDQQPTDESEPFVNGQLPETSRPRSFEKKLVEMLEVLKNEKDEFQDGDDHGNEERFSRNELDEPSPPPVPHQTPVPRGSTSSMPPDGKTNCADLEDFLLNLDKELEDDDET
ncbi:uncharacterized protein LOC110247259 isoform X2 [Exaiptasia diaphana]|uniref:CUB domain-containing protein n=1 Tax=Exaiptasia diaphana TaxID=2652724 RepID=A0A913XT58_EXADI|nr:uncharacterized protein LOC110247259 isoform X2 [Exaiptasia diaphana]KXJ24718.1 Bone morphogenetic protein 1 [Exaiptasia diaphana]